MERSPLALAALATVVVPGIDILQARQAPAPDGFDACYFLDGAGKTWQIRAPKDAVSGAALEAEAAFLRAIETYVDSGNLPFIIPKPAGFAPLIEGGRAVMYPHISGNALRLNRLTPGPGASVSLGRAIGAIHELPISLLDNSAFPSYTAEQYRDRKLSELDEGASSGLVPVPLLRRWETALENVALWRFAPVVTHTSLSEESIIMAHGQVSGIIDWSTVQVGDPADDLAWLVAAAPIDCIDSIFEAYQARRSEALDPHLVDRALLGSELALLSWLLHGIRKNDDTVISDATGMLADLVEATTDATHTGSFTISTMPAPTDRAPAQRRISESGVLAQATASVADITAPASLPSARSASSAPERSASSAVSATSGALNLETPDPSAEGTANLIFSAGSPSSAGSTPATGSEHSSNAHLRNYGEAHGKDLADEQDSVEDHALHNDIESRVREGEFALPDYSHATPPMPYADAKTEILTTLPNRDQENEDDRD